MTVHVDFEPVGRRGDCPAGSTLLDCARLLGVDLVNLCGGAGACGRCVVQIVAGPVSAPGPDESEFLTPQALAAGYRLACETKPLGDCKVRVPPESLTTPQRTQVEGEELPVEVDPPLRAQPFQVRPPSLEDLRGDAERLLDGLGVARLDLSALRALPIQARAQGWCGQAVVREDELVAILPPGERLLGLAVDLGTTKIAGYLMDLTSGETLAAVGLMNPQIAYGEDLIARMSYAGEGPSQAARMQELVVEALNQAVAELCAQAGARPEQVVEAVVVGNTAMHHLFLQLPVERLAMAPYVPAVQQALDVKTRDLGLQIAPGAYVHLLPNIAGYVGADHMAMILATGVAKRPGVVLALDIGTNTEVVLSNHGRLTSLSCASGPAFEGAHIKHGMRAAPGAIERVRLSRGRVEYQTIGAAPPAGICGSGILDTLAQLCQAGLVDERGRMKDHPWMRGERAQREMVLVPRQVRLGAPGEITFTQKDVRELQLAKGAMRTGIQVLLRTNGLGYDQIDEVIIAGAFGTYIDVGSAIAIGMLPPLPLDRFRQVGNAAGMGAKLALISRHKRVEAQALARRVGYVELAADPQFSETFARAGQLGPAIF